MSKKRMSDESVAYAQALVAGDKRQKLDHTEQPPHWLKLSPSPPEFPFVGKYFKVQVFLVNDQLDDKASPKPRNLPLYIELLYEDDENRVDNQSILELTKDSPTKFSNGSNSLALHMRLNELSMQDDHDGRQFVLRFSCPENSRLGPIQGVLSAPFTIVKHALKVTKQPPTLWYNAEGGRSNCIEIKGILHDSHEKRVVGREVPLHVQLLYKGDLSEVQDPDILKVDSVNSIRVDKQGYFQIRLRIDQVSKSHRNQPFVVRVTPNLSHDDAGLEVAPVLCSAVVVKSKRPKPKSARRYPTSSGSGGGRSMGGHLLGSKFRSSSTSSSVIGRLSHSPPRSLPPLPAPSLPLPAAAGVVPMPLVGNTIGMGSSATSGTLTLGDSEPKGGLAAALNSLPHSHSSSPSLMGSHMSLSRVQPPPSPGLNHVNHTSPLQQHPAPPVSTGLVLTPGGGAVTAPNSLLSANRSPILPPDTSLVRVQSVSPLQVPAIHKVRKGFGMDMELKLAQSDPAQANVFRWVQYVASGLRKMQWHHAGYESKDDGTVAYDLPIERCPFCWCYKDSMRRPQHAANCMIRNALHAYDTLIRHDANHLAMSAESDDDVQIMRPSRTGNVSFRSASDDASAIMNDSSAMSNIGDVGSRSSAMDTSADDKHSMLGPDLSRPSMQPAVSIPSLMAGMSIPRSPAGIAPLTAHKLATRGISLLTAPMSGSTLAGNTTSSAEASSNGTSASGGGKRRDVTRSPPPLMRPSSITLSSGLSVPYPIGFPRGSPLSSASSMPMEGMSIGRDLESSIVSVVCEMKANNRGFPAFDETGVCVGFYQYDEGERTSFSRFMPTSMAERNSREVKEVVAEYKTMLRKHHNSSAQSGSANGDQYAPNKVLITKDEFLDLEQMKEQVMLRFFDIQAAQTSFAPLPPSQASTSSKSMLRNGGGKNGQSAPSTSAKSNGNVFKPEPTGGGGCGDTRGGGGKGRGKSALLGGKGKGAGGAAILSTLSSLRMDR